MLVDNAKYADIKIERYEISSEKFELIEFRKFGNGWKQGTNTSIVSIKTGNQYSIETSSSWLSCMTSRIEVVDTTDAGFIIDFSAKNKSA